MGAYEIDIGEELRNLIVSSGGVLTVGILFEMRG
jgi:hypothetical protein